ncbi:hypothetical protein AZZ71_005408 [Klebsiella pneumoniae]|nr:hypothetical protein AZZ71_005408 [Klebsiella pneumoniae]
MPRAKIGRVTPVPAQPFFHFRRITLNPAVNRGVIDIHSAFSQHLLQLTVTDAVFAVPAYGPQNDVTLKMPAFEWVHVQLHQQKGMISLSPPTICNSAVCFIFLPAMLKIPAKLLCAWRASSPAIAAEASVTVLKLLSSISLKRTSTAFYPTTRRMPGRLFLMNARIMAKVEVTSR